MTKLEPQVGEHYRCRFTPLTYEVLLTDVWWDEGGETVVYADVAKHRKLVCHAHDFKTDFRRIAVPCPGCGGRGTKIFGGTYGPWVDCNDCSGCRLVPSPEAKGTPEVEIGVQCVTFGKGEEMHEYRLMSREELSRWIGHPVPCPNGSFYEQGMSFGWFSTQSPWTPGYPPRDDELHVIEHLVEEPETFQYRDDYEELGPL